MNRAPLYLCDDHADALVRHIKSRGLWDLVPQTPAQVRRYILGFRREPVPTLQYYSPLAYAAGCIVHLRLDIAHSLPATTPEPGSCPLCDLPSTLVLHWLSVAADCAQHAAAALLKTNQKITLSFAPRCPSGRTPKKNI